MTQTQEKKMQIEYVPISKIETHKDVPNIRSKITKAELKELIDSIKNHGIKSPLSCWRTNGKVYLESGFRRLEAAKELKLNEVPVVVQDYTQPVREALFGNMIENIEREDVNGIDLARRLQILIDMKMSKEEIGKRISRSQTWISQTLAFLKSDPKLQSMVQNGKLSLDEGKKIARLPEEHQAKVGASLAKAKELGDKGAKGRIKDGIKRATSKSGTSKPSARKIKVAINMASVIMGEMKKSDHQDTQDFFAVKGTYAGLKWALGEVDGLSLEKLGKEYGIKFGKDGFPKPLMAADKKNKKKKSPSKKQKKK
jgi:ParB/RepB/Spo0J family partition protein